jgi:hypothetical protein
VLALGLAGLGIWYAARPFAGSDSPIARQRRQTSSAAGAIPSTLDSVRAESSSLRDSATAAALTPANPGDSLGAAAYGVVIARYNTQAGVIDWLQRLGRDLPSPTYAPISVRGETWYRAMAGAYPHSAQAESLLIAMHAKGELRPDLGEVVRTPFAFLVDSLKPEAVRGMLSYFADRGQPVYALRQADGSVKLYVGAFETPQQAALFLDDMRTSDIRPVLVYRLGGVY